ncbi:MAG: sigma-54 dependent transcriptional regulator [Deltaproteobacteria bacterium]|jgi:two-component system response regulator HydG|nr:sigma-54 dependent transcriptional regulator [Deltaproteobacteria bacterium]
MAAAENPIIAENPILIVDDEPDHLFMLKSAVGDWGHAIETAVCGEDAFRMAGERVYSLILMDVRMKTPKDGLETLARLHDGTGPNRRTPVVIMTAFADWQDAVDALKGGAVDYLGKPLDLDVLRHSIDNILLRPAVTEVRAPEEGAASGLIGESQAFKDMLDIALRVAESEATVLITGESGTGKEEVAKFIQRNSPRAGENFVSINCTAISETLIESELFGFVRGAFTGAEGKRDGRLMAADRGTVFLDEIGDTSNSFQAKLLRAIQEGEIQRVGSDEVLKVDVRFIAATNKDLEKLVKQGLFREDLLYRLNVVIVPLPPLRERTGDLKLLAEHFLKTYAAKNKKPVKTLSEGAMKALMDHSWPGNIRELQNAVERGVILARGDVVTERDLQIRLGAGPSVPQPDPAALQAPDAPRPVQPLAKGTLEEMERLAVAEAYANAGGNKTKAAEKLGVTRKTLAAKVKKWGMDGTPSGNDGA